MRVLVVDGRVGTGEALSLNVEWLDAAPKKVLDSFQSTGCKLRACDEALLGDAAERSGGITLRFVVQQLGLPVGV